MSGFMHGMLTFWSAEEGFGELTPTGAAHAPVAVFTTELAVAGVRNPRLGDRFLFQIGTTSKGMTGAVDLRPDGWDPQKEKS